jgi:hypothetical protein
MGLPTFTNGFRMNSSCGKFESGVWVDGYGFLPNK